MSSISQGIAGSVTQAALQQSQVAKARDARKNERAERARRMREILAQRLVRVDDARAVEPVHLRSDSPADHPEPDSTPLVDERVSDADDGEPSAHHVDVTA